MESYSQKPHIFWSRLISENQKNNSENIMYFSKNYWMTKEIKKFKKYLWDIDFSNRVSAFEWCQKWDFQMAL